MVLLVTPIAKAQASQNVQIILSLFNGQQYF
jgi:hypothetical protein